MNPPPSSSALAKTPQTRWYLADLQRMLSEPPPEIQWVVQGLIPLGFPGIIAAEGGIGKSMTALLISLGLASGVGVLGRPVSPGAPCGVVYVSMEDDEDEWHRRLHRGMEIMRETPGWSEENEQLLKERLRPMFPNRGSGVDFQLDKEWRNIAQEASQIPGGCGLIFLDTFSRLSGGDENSVKETRPFLEAQAALVQHTGASVIPIHHVAKGNSTTSAKDLHSRLHVDAIRGSSAIVNNVRFALMLATLTPAEAASAGLDQEKAQRSGYVALRLAKMNSGPQQPVLILERREEGAPGAGFLSPCSKSEEVLASLRTTASQEKRTKCDQVLLVIAGAGGLGGLNQKAEAHRLWPESKNAMTQWQKQLSALRKPSPPLLADPSLTEAGWARAEELGSEFARARRSEQTTAE